MSIATLDKSTDKIFDRMTPEELAKYVNDRFVNWAQVAQETEITKEEIDREADIFVKKHINPLSPAAYVEYMKALHRESEATLIRALGNIQILAFQKSIDIQEWKINSLLFAIYVMEQILPPAEADEQLIGLKESISDCLHEIQEIEQVIEDFTHHDLWTTRGGALDVPERESVLVDTLFNSFMM